MSSRPSGRTAFDNLRPTILRQPLRSPVSAEAEARLLDSPTSSTAGDLGSNTAVPLSLKAVQPAVESTVISEVVSLPGRALLKKKRRDLLIPVTFRMPKSLKDRLESIAELHEINQTDLINEAIDLNLQRYSQK